MFKDSRYINAGENEFHRWGKKARAKAEACLTPNEKGYYSIEADGGKYWTFGTSEGKYGEFARFGDTFFSVNKGGFLYAKAGTEKGEAFTKMIKTLINCMVEKNHEEILRSLHGEECDDIF